MFLEKWWPRFPVLVFFLNCLMSPKKKWRMTEHYKHTILETCMGIDDPYVKKPRWRIKWNAISKMIKNGLAEGMVTRKLCVEVLDLVLTSFQTSFFSAPTVSKVQITDMLLLSTSFFSYPLPRSHRQGGFEKKMFPSTSYSFLFPIKAAAHMFFSPWFAFKVIFVETGLPENLLIPIPGETTWNYAGVSKNRGTPKIDGENNEKNPMNPWMIWGENPLFSETSSGLPR